MKRKINCAAKEESLVKEFTVVVSTLYALKLH